MDTLRRLYMIVVQNIHKAREKLPKKEDEPHKFKVNDMVLVKNPDAAVFEPRYQPNFRVTVTEDCGITVGLKCCTGRCGNNGL